MNSLPKIVVILGPTASGKSDLAVRLAKEFNGEVISADSRQVYKDLNIGTGKITKKEMRGVPHHLLDTTSPTHIFTVQDFKVQAEKAIEEILKKGKVPIICGGTGFYIQAVIDNVEYPDVPPNSKLRKTLKKKTPAQLHGMLARLDKSRADAIDPRNPHRLIRAIEIATALGKVPAITSKHKYTTLQIGLRPDNVKLRQKIHDRLLKRMGQGMVKEAERLHTAGLSWRRMEELGLEYRYLARYLQKKITKQELLDELEKEIWQYAKRQNTWFKRDARIRWFAPEQRAKMSKAVREYIGKQNRPD